MTRALNAYTGTQFAFPVAVTGFDLGCPGHHPILKHYPGFITKQSFGGISILIHANTFLMYLQADFWGTYGRQRAPGQPKPTSWDWKLCEILGARYTGILAASTPSVVQHHGVVGMNSRDRERIDIAHNFDLQWDGDTLVTMPAC